MGVRRTDAFPDRPETPLLQMTALTPRARSSSLSCLWPATSAGARVLAIVGWWTALYLPGWFTGRLWLRWVRALPLRALSAARRRPLPSGSGRRQEFVVAWVQPTRSPDASGWYGSRFIIEFRRGAQPRARVLGPGFRFCQLLDDEDRERVRAVQNAVIRRLPPAPARELRMRDDRARDWYLAQGRQVAAAYRPDHDIWFRHRD